MFPYGNALEQDLWQNPVESTCVLSYLDNRNIDWLDDGPGRGKQQHKVILKI